MKKLIAHIALIVLCLPVLAQDWHSSQPFSQAQLFNPAATGQIEGQYRLTAAYRDQWRSVTVPYQTFSAAGELSWYADSRAQRSRFGAGFFIRNDQAGDGALRNTEGGLLFAYHQYLGRSDRGTVISYGIGASFGQRRVNAQDLVFNSQWSTDGFDPSLPNQENFSSLQDGYFDMEVGTRILIPLGLQNHWVLEGALHHLNRAQVSFFNADERLDFRYVAATSAKFRLQRAVSLHPRVLFSQQENAREILAGSNLSFKLDEGYSRDKVIIGAFYRWQDALIFVTGFDMNSVQFLFSYDLNFSPLTPASDGQGAFELSLVFVGKTSKKPLLCPDNF